MVDKVNCYSEYISLSLTHTFLPEKLKIAFLTGDSIYYLILAFTNEIQSTIFEKQKSKWFQVANVIMEVFGLPVKQYPCHQVCGDQEAGPKMCPLVVVAGIFIAGVDLMKKACFWTNS